MPCWISVLNMARAQACPSLGSFDCKNGRLLTRPKLGCRLLLLHGPRLRRPKSKIQTGRWVLDLTLDFGFWVLDFGYRIVVISVLLVAGPNTAVRILAFGFCARFGFCRRLFLLHADSGRRAFVIIVTKLNR